MQFGRLQIAGLALLSIATFFVVQALLPGSGGKPLHVLLLDPPVETPAPLQAQIDGAINRPGIYPIRRGDRVSDLVRAAGGLRDDADLAALDEARHVSDGDHIHVAPVGTPQALPALVAINHASRDELLTLPGVTVQQAAIIQASVRNKGPLISADDLVARGLMNAAQASRVAALVSWTR